jgi:hypothetical protein
VSAASVLALGRARAQALMVDTCTIQRQTGSSTDAYGNVTPTLTQIYSGPCKLQESSGLPRDANPTPQVPVLMVYRQLHLPVATSTGVRAGDLATMDTCVNDPDMVDAVLVIRSERGKSFGTARRLDVEQVTG